MSAAASSLSLQEAAADWYFRRQGSDWTGADERAFSAWLAADPQHEQVYQSMMRTWNDFQAIPRPHLAVDTVAGTAPARPAAAPRKPKASRAGAWSWATTWRFAPAFAAALALLVAGGWFVYDNTPGYSTEVATAHGETRTLDLPDGTRIALNMDSTLEVRLYPRRREVVLNKGEAYFQVAHAPQHPFTVNSGRSEVRVVGTVFNVRAAPPQLVVKVQEGRVEVRPDREAGNNVAVLSAGQAVAADPDTRALHPFGVAPDMIGDWRSGQLVFRRTALAEVAADLARYLGRPVVLSDTRLARLAVSGYVATGAPQGFIESLPDLIAVRVERRADGGYQISPR